MLSLRCSLPSLLRVAQLYRSSGEEQRRFVGAAASGRISFRDSAQGRSMTMSTNSGPSKRKVGPRRGGGARPPGAAALGCHSDAGAAGVAPPRLAATKKFVAPALNGPARRGLPALPRSGYAARQRMQVVWGGRAPPVAATPRCRRLAPAPALHWRAPRACTTHRRRAPLS